MSATSKKFNILVCLNRNLLYQLIVLLESITENLSDDEQIDLFCFETDFNYNDKSLLNEWVSEHGHLITIIHVSRDILSGFKESGRITLEAYLRLACIDFIPKNIHRILYLDIDIIVDKNIGTLYNCDFEDKCICAMKAPIRNISYEEWLNYSVTKQATLTYFNSGVLLINVDMWRKNDFNVLKFTKIYNDIYEKMGMAPPVQDQSVLNVAFKNSVKLLDQRKFNHRAAQPIDRVLMESDPEYATIIHYTNDLGTVKPWEYHFSDGESGYYALRYGKEINADIHELHKKWWAYAAKTPYYDILDHAAKLRTYEYVKHVQKLKEYGNLSRRNKELSGELLKWKSYAALFENIIIKNISPEKLIKWLKFNNYKKVALYCDMKPAKLFLEMVAGSSEVHVEYIADNSSKRTDIPVVSTDSERFPTVDVMFICNYEYMEKIKDKLSKRADFPFYSIDKILESGE